MKTCGYVCACAGSCPTHSAKWDYTPWLQASGLDSIYFNLNKTTKNALFELRPFVRRPHFNAVTYVPKLKVRFLSAMLTMNEFPCLPLNLVNSWRFLSQRKKIALFVACVQSRVHLEPRALGVRRFTDVTI